MLNFNHKNSRMQQAWMKPDPRFFFPERGVGLLGIIMPEGGGGGICLFLLSYVNFELDPSPYNSLYNELQIVIK